IDALTIHPSRRAIQGGGTIVVAFAAGSRLRVHFERSGDGGQTWSGDPIDDGDIIVDVCDPTDCWDDEGSAPGDGSDDGWWWWPDDSSDDSSSDSGGYDDSGSDDSGG